MVFAFLVVITLIGLYMAWNIGANDVANSMGCAVGCRAVSIRWAVILAGICEFSGAVLVGSHVTNTVRKGIVDPESLMLIPGISQGDAATLLILGMTASLLSAALWLNFGTWMGMPVSTTHAIVGSIAGFGVTVAGWTAVDWFKMIEIVSSWFISPVVGGVLGFLLFKMISRWILTKHAPASSAVLVTPFIVAFVFVVLTFSIIHKGLRQFSFLRGNYSFLVAALVGLAAAVVARILIKRKLTGKETLEVGRQLELVERSFSPLVIICSCTVAFSHGANDVANAIGPLAAVVDVVRNGVVKMHVEVPMWVLLLGGAGIVLGLATFGYRVMHTVGSKITELTPSRGVAASIAATTTVLSCTKLGLPVSTTHTLVGAVLGIGMARGISSVNRQVTRNIFTSWIVTVPAAAVLSVVLFLLGRIFLFDVIRAMLPPG